MISLLISELVFTEYNLRIGLIFFSTMLAGLISSLIFFDFEENIKNLLMCVMILPITRLVGSTMPIQNLNFFTRISLVYTVVFVTTFLIFYNTKINFKEIGYSFKKLEYLPIAIILGMILAYIEYNILSPERLIDSLSFKNIMIGVVSMLVFTGYVEELIFRGLIQNILEKLYSQGKALVFSNILFTIMHIVWRDPLEILFVFMAGMTMGAIFAKTRSLILVSSVHGTINFFLFVIFPFLKS